MLSLISTSTQLERERKVNLVIINKLVKFAKNGLLSLGIRNISSIFSAQDKQHIQ